MSGSFMKRRQKRLESLNLVSFAHLGKDGKPDLEGVGRTLDLSEGGVLLEVTSPVSGDSETMEVTIGIRHHIIKAMGRMVHQRQLANSNYALGISFSSITPDDRRVIVQFLEQEEK